MERFEFMLRYSHSGEVFSNAISFWFLRKRTQTSVTKKWKSLLFYASEIDMAFEARGVQQPLKHFEPSQ